MIKNGQGSLSGTTSPRDVNPQGGTGERLHLCVPLALPVRSTLCSRFQERRCRTWDPALLLRRHWPS